MYMYVHVHTCINMYVHVYATSYKQYLLCTCVYNEVNNIYSKEYVHVHDYMYVCVTLMNNILSENTRIMKLCTRTVKICTCTYIVKICTCIYV